MRDLKVIIAGAGLGGLACAAFLHRAGFAVELYEQSNTLSEVGAGIQLSANAMHGLRALGLGARIEEMGVKPRAYVFRLHDTGEVVQEFALAAEHERTHGAPYVQLHRADLHELLVGAARAGSPDLIRLGKRLVGYDETATGVVARFADGSTATGDLLIGADGLKSIVRHRIAGDTPATYTGDAAWRLTIPSDRLPPNLLEPAMNVFMGPGGHAVCYYLRAGRMLNFVGLVEKEDVSEESWTVRFPWEALDADFRGWHPAIRAVVDAVDRDQCYRWSLHLRPPLSNWSTDRVTLLGDSAHATLPYLAQGAAMAIEDGVVLSRALTQSASVPDALQLYQRNRIERTSRIVMQSSANRKLFHLHSPEEIRAEFARRNQGAERNGWLYSYNPLTVPLV